jgi:hypothetical protein
MKDGIMKDLFIMFGCILWACGTIDETWYIHRPLNFAEVCFWIASTILFFIF